MWHIYFNILSGMYWRAIWHVLAFYLACNLALYLAYVLTFYLAYGILSGMQFGVLASMMWHKF